MLFLHIFKIMSLTADGLQFRANSFADFVMLFGDQIVTECSLSILLLLQVAPFLACLAKAQKDEYTSN